MEEREDRFFFNVFFCFQLFWKKGKRKEYGVFFLGREIL